MTSCVADHQFGSAFGRAGMPPVLTGRARWHAVIDTHAPRTNEARLVAIAKNSDRQAFAELFREFAPVIRGYLVKGGVPAAQADDLVQEVMLSVWRKAGSYDPTRAAAATWIFAIARNRRIDVLRRERRYECDDSDTLYIASTAPTADAELDRQRQSRAIRTALADLPDEQGQILLRAYYADKTLAVIAEESAIPLGTVKSRVRLALQRLRSALAGEEGS
jgi:RNA polymerase sigma factor (sigma-70 family)